MSGFALTTYDETSRSLIETPLPLGAVGDRCQVRLAVLPGAEGVHLRVTAPDGETLYEVHTAGDDEIVVSITRKEQWLELTSQGRGVYRLPSVHGNQPENGLLWPQHPRLDSDLLDIAVVIDGTAQHFDIDDEGSFVPLLDSRGVWGKMQQELLQTLSKLAELHPRKVRLALMAYGDIQPPQVGALDLEPDYLLYPIDESQRRLQTFDVGSAVDQLRRIRSTSGGDFVDGLADALNACSRLTWEPEARKLLLVLGDSPGHSLSPETPWGADASVRERDVDSESIKLHKLGVEVVTLYHKPDEDSGLFDRAESMEAQLLRYAEAQFARLATRPQFALKTRDLNATQLVQLLTQPQGPTARGRSWGVWLGLLSGM